MHDFRAKGIIGAIWEVKAIVSQLCHFQAIGFAHLQNEHVFKARKLSPILCFQLFLLFLNITFFFSFFPEVIMSDSINIQVNKWKNNRWARSHSTGTAAASRELGSPSLSAPAQAMAAGQPCFKCTEETKPGQDRKVVARLQRSASSLSAPLMAQSSRQWELQGLYQPIRTKLLGLFPSFGSL